MDIGRFHQRGSSLSGSVSLIYHVCIVIFIDMTVSPPFTDAMALRLAIIKGVAGAAARLIVRPPLIVAGLGALGFGTGGVAAGKNPQRPFLRLYILTRLTIYLNVGSAAATIQSVVYGGATTGLFSICQSIGATGSVGAAGTAISGLIGGVWAARRR